MLTRELPSSESTCVTINPIADALVVPAAGSSNTVPDIVAGAKATSCTPSILRPATERLAVAISGISPRLDGICARIVYSPGATPMTRNVPSGLACAP